MEFGEPGFGEVRPCPHCRPNATTERLRRISGLLDYELKRRLADVVTENRPGTQKMVEACRAFCNEPKGILTIYGGTGNGKTMTVQALVNELIMRSVEAVYIRAFDLLQHVQEGFRDNGGQRGQSVHQRFKRFSTVKVLAVDELDKVHETAWAQSQWTALIDERYRLGNEVGYGTVLAMNANPAGLSQWIASRLLDGTNVVVHNIDADIRPALRR